MKLLGTGGINALDRSKCSFIIDVNTHWSALQLSEVETRDAFSGATIESGRLTGLWGYDINVSGSMHKMSSTRKATLNGIIDDGSLTGYGAILAVRWDLWKFGWKRRMTMETVRNAQSDTFDIVAMFRVGLVNRDYEGSAETFMVGV
jgi:hypothetical protein